MATVAQSVGTPSPAAQQEKKPTAQEVIWSLLKGVHTLYYRQGNNPHPMQKNFYSNGKTLRDTVDIAKRHCEVMGIRFIRVTPFLVDLRAEEIQHTGGQEVEQ